MTENGWTKSDLAKSHAFAHGCSKLGKGKKRSQWRTVKRLAAVTGKPEHWFFMEEGQEDARRTL
jgi:hypothetical protein